MLANGGRRTKVERTVGTSVGHRQKARGGVLLLEVLVGELLAIDGLTAGTVSASEITTLNHELRDDAVEAAALVVKRLARATGALLTCTCINTQFSAAPLLK
jgi:hypothetical protein